MITIDWKPSPRKLRQFALASIIGFPLLGLLFGRLFSLDLLTGSIILGAIVCVVGLLFPRGVLPIYLLLIALTFPIGLAVSWIALPLVYYGVFTPIALGLKLLGKDPMDRQLRTGDTYWIKRKPAPSAANYYKQF